MSRLDVDDALMYPMLIFSLALLKCRNMLKVRLQRTGRRNGPSFRIVVLEHTSGPKAGKVVEKVGTYNPRTKTRTLDAERVKYWLSVGAKASDTVHNLLISAGIIEGEKISVLPKSFFRKGDKETGDTAETAVPSGVEGQGEKAIPETSVEGERGAVSEAARA